MVSWSRCYACDACGVVIIVGCPAVDVAVRVRVAQEVSKAMGGIN